MSNKAPKKVKKKPIIKFQIFDSFEDLFLELEHSKLTKVKVRVDKRMKSLNGTVNQSTRLLEN